MIRASAQPPRPTGFVSVLQEHDSTIPPTGSPHFLLVSQFQMLAWIRALCEMFAPRTSSTLPLHDHGAGRTSFLNQGALLLMRRETAQQVLQSLQSTVWHTKLLSAAGPALPDNCPSRHPGSKRVTAGGRGRLGTLCSCTGSVSRPPNASWPPAHPGQRLRPHVGLLARPASRRAADMVRTAAALASSRASPLRDARRGTQTLTAVRAAAALCAHGQGGCLGERIQGERTALRQAVHPNGTPPSSTVSLAVMRHLEGIVLGAEHGGQAVA